MKKIYLLVISTIVLFQSCTPTKEDLEKTGYQTFPEIKFGVHTPCKLILDTLTNKNWYKSNYENIKTFGCPTDNQSITILSNTNPSYFLSIIKMDLDTITGKAESGIEWLDGYTVFLDENSYAYEHITFEGCPALKVDWKKGNAKELLFATPGYVCKTLVRSKDSLDILFDRYISKIKRYK